MKLKEFGPRGGYIPRAPLRSATALVQSVLRSVGSLSGRSVWGGLGGWTWCTSPMDEIFSTAQSLENLSKWYVDAPWIRPFLYVLQGLALTVFL